VQGLAAVLEYRSFRNEDPPALVAIWNDAFTGRGSVHLRGTSALEHFLFAKPYFDPAGLIIATYNGSPVGFAHAGFGTNAQETALSVDHGVTCLLGVRAAHRRHGIGSELLRRSENYLRSRGAKTLSMGCMRPLNPFYLGLYGGSSAPGILVSDSGAEPFLLRHGYRAVDSCLVFQRRLTSAFNPSDGRFTTLRRRYDVRAVLAGLAISWWQECVLGPLEVLEFRLEDKLTGQAVARARVWEMQGFSQRWNESAIGVADLEVRPEQRRQGLGKFLLAQVLRQVQEQYFSLAEVQAKEEEQAAQSLLRGIGFEQVDTGRIYRKDAAATA
jgi:ribosomal protein S18 acetylase RimI-like enzyme